MVDVYKRQAADRFPMRITPYYLSLIDPNDPNDPIRRMCIPVSYTHLDVYKRQLFGGEAHSAVYRHENAAQGANLRITGICGM